MPAKNHSSMQVIIIGHGDKPGQFLAESLSSEACGSCQACRGMTGGELPAPIRMIVVAPEMPLEVGMCVEVSARPGLGALSAFLLFGLPLIGFFTGLAATGTLTAAMGNLPTDGWHFLLGILGLFLGAIASWAVSRLLGDDLFLLHVEKLIASEQAKKNTPNAPLGGRGVCKS